MIIAVVLVVIINVSSSINMNDIYDNFYMIIIIEKSIKIKTGNLFIGY